ncbi:MAG: class I SAM-dependent methyltransferase [Candidatus Binatia bacterium]
MEGAIARWYNARAKRERDDYRVLAGRIAGSLPPEARVLEVAPGPGYLAIELAKLGKYRIVGLDISETFVDIASRNADREGVEVDFRHGDVADMPFSDATFDSVVCRAAFQNFSQPDKALREMRRVLKVGGAAVLIELRRDVSSQAINEHLRKVARGLREWLTNQLLFRLLLVRRAYTEDELRQFASTSGFASAEIRKGPVFLEAWLSNAPR